MLQMFHFLLWNRSLSGPRVQGFPIDAFVFVGEVGSGHWLGFRPLQREEGNIRATEYCLAKDIDAVIS